MVRSVRLRAGRQVSTEKDRLGSSVDTNGEPGLETKVTGFGLGPLALGDCNSSGWFDCLFISRQGQKLFCKKIPVYNYRKRHIWFATKS